VSEGNSDPFGRHNIIVRIQSIQQQLRLGKTTDRAIRNKQRIRGAGAQGFGIIFHPLPTDTGNTDPVIGKSTWRWEV
jgi:hypothetical protein